MKRQRTAGATHPAQALRLRSGWRNGMETPVPDFVDLRTRIRLGVGAIFTSPTRVDHPALQAAMTNKALAWCRCRRSAVSRRCP